LRTAPARRGGGVRRRSAREYPRSGRARRCPDRFAAFERAGGCGAAFGNAQGPGAVIGDGRQGDHTLTGAASQPQAQPPPEVGQLLIYAEGRLVRSFALNVPVVTIGRTPANVLPLPHESVSRAHADVRVTPDGVILTDRGSANGTWVNDVRLAPE